MGWRSPAHGCAPGGQLPGAAPAHDTVRLRCAVGVHHSRCVPSMDPRSCSSNSGNSRQAGTTPRCASVGQAEVGPSPPPPGPGTEDCARTRTPPPSMTDGTGAGPGAALPCDPTCLAAQPAPAPHAQAAHAPHTHRHGGISLPCVPPRGTGAVISPAGLATGQPSTRRTSSGAQGRATSMVPEVQMRP